MIYLVTYDLVKVKDYTRIEAGIRRYTATKVLHTVWLVQTELQALELARDLVVYLDGDDRLLVTEVTRNTSWRAPMIPTENMHRWIDATSR